MSKLKVLAGVAVLAVAFAVTAAASAAQQASADTVPGDDKAKALLDHVCTGCHELDVLAGQGRTVEGWQKVIDTMADRGAQATDAEFEQIAAYLAKTHPVAPAPVAAPMPAPPAT